ncbi:MAG TPA: hypothetical protein VJP80_07710 [Candidatus Saccharimonadales bacterium]|nr:hypothetical protein [Candidatus Saccharimonadales bacterium]
MIRRNIFSPQENFPEAIRMDTGIHEWDERTDALIAEEAHIITFRGAGTVNGIEPHAADRATDLLHDYVTSIRATGKPVALMYDGDTDNRARPDLGYVFGSLVELLGNDVTAIAAQKEGWYNPVTENGAIKSAGGRPYETYVFPDELLGGHGTLTQSERLITYSGYEQYFVGPAGPMAFSQLTDLSKKASSRLTELGLGPIPVTVLETPNNPAIGDDLIAQLNTADEQTRAEIAAKLAQRERQPYGALFTPEGELAIDASHFPGIELNIIQITG